MTASQPTNEAMIRWDRVKTPADYQLIERIKAVYGRRNRKERRLFKAFATQANKRGLLVPATQEESCEA